MTINVDAHNIFENSCDEITKAIRLWVLRLLVEMDGNSKFLAKYGFEEYSIANFLGLTEMYLGDFDINSAREQITKLYRKESKRDSGIPKNTVVGKNLRRLSKSLGLTKVDTDLIHFAVICKSSMVLSDAISLFSNTKPSTVPRILAACLRLEVCQVNDALRPDRALYRTGLMQLDFEKSWNFHSALNLLDGFIESISIPDESPINMFRTSFLEAARPKLSMKDIEHISFEFETVRSYLRKACEVNQKGVNILLYGPPGTGKTEFARLVAKETGTKLYEIGFEASNGLPLSSSDRFRAFRTAQTLFSRRKRHLILFDEVEDVFRVSDPRDKEAGKGLGQKAWINRLLEDNEVPSIWITNNHYAIDNAFLRRFDLIIQISNPPKRKRVEILEESFKDLGVESKTLISLSDNAHLSPAVVERTAKVMSLIGANTKDNTELRLLKILNGSMVAMGLGRVRSSTGTAELLDYDLGYLNADCDISEIAREVINKGGGRLCLYGPPGTGKSAFARFLADSANKPLLVKKASDLISPYIGETEKNMANMFYEAQETDAILVLDEADTYLQDRWKLSRSWEISNVNEMLTQIETFEGVFICSTNLMDSLDQAVLRRFDLKIRFDQLTSQQVQRLFTETAERLGLKVDSKVTGLLGNLNQVTPGDFATVIRQSRYRKVADSYQLYDRLREECKLKSGSAINRIGF